MWGTDPIFVFIFITQPVHTNAFGRDEDEDEEEDEEAGRPRGAGAYEGGILGICGSIGFLGFNGTMDLNIAIRTVLFHDGKARLQGGGGITARSDPAEEYDETFAKVRNVLRAGT